MYFVLKIISLFFILATPRFILANDQLTVPAQVVTAIDHFIQDQLQQKKVVGCAVAIVDHGNIIFMKTYGVLKQGKKDFINKRTLFQLGSISKSITATLIAKLIKDKYLTLDLPAYQFIDSISLKTTLWHILSHTTGYEKQQWNQKIEAATPRHLLLKALRQTPNIPGKSFNYHNLAFSMVEDIVSIIMNDSFQNILKSRLLMPLGMNDTTIGSTNFIQTPNFASPHKKNNKGHFYPSKTYSCAYHDSVCSAGGINSTITDMAAFLQLQLGFKPNFLTLDDLEDFHAAHVEAPDALAWLKINPKKSIQSYYGLGWRSIDYGTERIVFHGGWLKGFKNFLGFIPQRKVGIVILNNSEESFAQKVAFTFFDLLSSLKG